MLINRALCHSWLTQVTFRYHANIASRLQACRHNQPPQRFWQPPVRHFHAHRPRSSNIKPNLGEPAADGNTVPTNNVIKAIAFTGAFSVGCFAGATIMEYENTRNRDSWWQLKQDVRRYWDSLSPGDKTFAPILVCNLLAFALWRVPAMRTTMLTYFTSNPAARIVCWPMFLSTFSHYSVMHIFANMYVLHSFSNAAVLSMGKEQFMAVYLSAGVFSSLMSVLYKAGTRNPGMSLGASGAIMTVLAYVCAQYPETQLSILFLPTVTFSAGAAIKVIMGIDFAGCVMGWKFFDHAAHLGGAMFGIFWAHYGAQLWAKRISLLNYYHELRRTKQK
ncbi:hypothetical protein ACLKA7_012406 [Drosophila subpalustris]